MQFPDHSRSTLVGERSDAGVLLLNFASRLLQEMGGRGRRVGALFHFVNGCPAMVQSPTRWNQFVARTLGGPGLSLRGRSLLRGRAVRRSGLSYFFPEWLVGCARRARSGAVYPLVCLLPRSLSMCARSDFG